MKAPFTCRVCSLKIFEFRRVALSCLVALASSVYGQESPPEYISQEVAVKSAKDLNVTAPNGDHVAVLDQSGPSKAPGASPSQDHHNGWLTLSVEKLDGDAVKVKGKYYIPATTVAVPEGLRFTLRQRDVSGLLIFSDKTLDMRSATAGNWVDFEISLPIDKSVKQGGGSIYLLLSAVPFAGPIYLDHVQVTDPQGNQLWKFPDFEGLK